MARQHMVIWTLGILIEVSVAAALPVAAGQEPSLRDAFADHFAVGVGMDGMLPADYSPQELRLVQQQFATITPANCMKMTHLQPKEGQFRWEMADALVAYASAHGLKACGHCLLWAKDERTPDWVFEKDGEPVSREVLFERLRAHIQTVAGRYRGKVASWDVVNEAVGDGQDLIRPSKWHSILGDDFIAQAFRMAHEADPQAVLVYNDYNMWMPQKREKAVKLLGKLVEEGVPVHAVGMQGHWELDAIPLQDVEDTIKAFQGLGLKVMVTELDVDAVPRGRWWAEGGKYREEMAKTDPYKDGCPADVLQRQAEQYAELFKIFLKYSESIDRITFWDLHDGRSWLNHFPWERTDYPLLFDRQAQPKPAFHAVIKTATQTESQRAAALPAHRQIRVVLVGDSTVHDQGGWGAGFAQAATDSRGLTPGIAGTTIVSSASR